jgi:hypothetical protein
VSMRLTPSATARRRRAFAPSRSRVSPHEPGPTRWSAPNPSRRTSRSPPRTRVSGCDPPVTDLARDDHRTSSRPTTRAPEQGGIRFRRLNIELAPRTAAATLAPRRRRPATKRHRVRALIAELEPAFMADAGFESATLGVTSAVTARNCSRRFVPSRVCWRGSTTGC